MEWIEANMALKKGISFQEECSKDEDLLLKLFYELRESERILSHMDPAQWSAFLKDQLRLRELDYRRRFHDGRFLVIFRHRKSIGRIVIHETTSALKLVDIELLSKEQNRGYGTLILKHLLKEAHHKSKDMTLSVNINNPRAMKLYTALGFKTISQSHFGYEMHYISSLNPSPR